MTLKIAHLTYTLRKRDLIHNLSFSCNPGRLVGILGPNGSGKSTLLKTLTRIWQPTAGAVYWKDRDLASFTREELSRTLSLVPQSPQLYFEFTVYTLVAMGRYPLSRSLAKNDHFIEEALKQVNLWHLRDQLVTRLSGGEKQRAYIARALVTQAPILLLDEPIAYLDLRHQLEIWSLLRSLVQQGKLVIVTIHDLAAAKRYCDDLLILNQGKSHGMGSFETLMTPDLLQEIFGVKVKNKKEAFEFSLHSE